MDLDLNRSIDVASIKREIKALRKNIELELVKRKFVFVAEENTKHFEQDKLFGDAVYDKFEDARQDLKDAGSCLAIGLPTASVFHMMRVAEIGLRNIAAKVKVKLTDKGKPLPVEFATWNKVIEGIKSKINAARMKPKSARQNEQLQFYSDAADHCTYIRDLWRNDVSHHRKNFNDGEALGVMTRVKQFMELLAKGQA